MDWGKIISALAPVVGKTLSGGAKGMEQSRDLQNTQNTQRDRTALDAIGENERAVEERRKLEMAQAELDQKTKADGYKQALRSQYLQSWTPAQRPGSVPTMHGGFNTVPQSSKDLAAKFEQDATVRALQGQQFDPLAPQQSFAPTPIKQPSLWEKLSGAAGLGLTASAAVKAALKKAGVDDGTAVGTDGGL